MYYVMKVIEITILHMFSGILTGQLVCKATEKIHTFEFVYDWKLRKFVYDCI